MKIMQIKKLDKHKAIRWDIAVAEHHNFFANGVLVHNSTGEDITANVLRMQGVPRFIQGKITWTIHDPVGNTQTVEPKIAPDFTGFVRGEIMLFNEEWKKLDPDQLSNPRNLGNGMARRKDGEGCENLRFVAFRGFGSDGEPLGQTEMEMLSTLRTLGFDAVASWGQLTVDKVKRLYAFAQGELPKAEDNYVAYRQEICRDKLPFEIDGLVVKLEDFKLQELLGESNNRPKGQIAFKFPPRGAATRLLSVDWSVGHTGSIHPTANLEPVRIGGVTVSRASLHNMDEIRRLGISIRDLVNVCRGGDVIPTVTGVREAAYDSESIFPPDKCPGCGGPVGKRHGVKGDEGVHLYCLGDNCGAQALGKIKTWIKKLDIQGLGDVYIEALFNTRWVSSGQRIVGTPADLYKLRSAKFEYLMSGHTTIISPKLVTKILDEIDKKRELILSDFLGSLGIDGLGRRRVVLVQQALPGEFDTLADWASGKLVEKAKEAGLPNAAAGIYAQIKSALPLIDELLAAGVKVVDKPKEDTAQKPMAKTDKPQFCFTLTGKFPDHPKSWYHDRITEAGHRYEESYKKGVTTHLAASDPASGSSKMKKAEKDGVPVISDAKLLAMLAQ